MYISRNVAAEHKKLHTGAEVTYVCEHCGETTKLVFTFIYVFIVPGGFIMVSFSVTACTILDLRRAWLWLQFYQLIKTNLFL